MVRRLIAVALVLLFATAAWAEELTSKEKRWIRDCVVALTDKSERVRKSAESALAEFGVAAIPGVIPVVKKLKTDADWQALARALAAMGAAQASQALRDRRSEWPDDQRKQIDTLAHNLRLGRAAAGASKDLPTSPEAIEAHVRTLLEPFASATSFRPFDRRIDKVVKLGRPAIPAVVKILIEGEGKKAGYLGEAAARALHELVEERDVPLLRRLLVDGHYRAAGALAKLASKDALDALVEPVNRGFLEFHLLWALDRHGAKSRIQRALLQWLEQYGPGGESIVGDAALLLSRHRVLDAKPVLKNLLEKGKKKTPAIVKWGVAAAAAHLGEKAGIPALIEVFANTEEDQGWARHRAGHSLNRVAGRRTYKGAKDLQPDGDLPKPGELPHTTALKRFRAWWKDVGERMRFDRQRWAWTVDEPK